MKFEIPSPSHLADGGTPIPYGLRVAPDGSVWGTELHGNRIARLDPQSGAVRTYDMPVAVSGPRRPVFDALPYVVRVDRTRGRIWIGTGAADAVFMFDPRTEKFQMYPLPSRGALVRHVDIHDATGEVWLAFGAAPGIPARIAGMTSAD